MPINDPLDQLFRSSYLGYHNLYLFGNSVELIEHGCYNFLSIWGLQIFKKPVNGKPIKPK